MSKRSKTGERLESFQDMVLLKEKLRNNIQDLELMRNEGLEGGRFLDQKILKAREELVEEVDAVLAQLRDDFRMQCKKHK